MIIKADPIYSSQQVLNSLEFMKLLTPSPYEKRLVILLTGEFKDKWVSLKGEENFTNLLEPRKRT